MFTYMNTAISEYHKNEGRGYNPASRPVRAFKSFNTFRFFKRSLFRKNRSVLLGKISIVFVKVKIESMRKCV